MDATQIIDPFGRRISYLRLSVTDRCDFRCRYCMSENMDFLPRDWILSFEEIETLVQAFIELGVTKVRITGGEPLVRKGIVTLLHKLNRLAGLKELVLTTNGSQLAQHAPGLKSAGIQRINISLDSLDPVSFKVITRTGSLQQVLRGIEAAQDQGFRRIKLNAVIIRGANENQILPLLAYACRNRLDISYIEEMPLGKMTGRKRSEDFVSSPEIRSLIEQQYSLLPSTESSGGPARYFYLPGYPDTRIGFISPHSHNFCSSCNRVRVTAEGKLVLCLGNDGAVDLKSVLREHPGETTPVKHCIMEAIKFKPEHHEFRIHDEVQVVRFMNMTGG